MRTLLTWTRADYGVLQGVIIVFVAATALVTLGLPLWDWATGGPVQGVIDTGIQDARRPIPEAWAAPAPGATLTWDGSIQVELASPSVGDRLLLLIPGLLLVVIVVVVAILLLRLLAATRAGRPFTSATVRDLWILALVVLVGSVLVPAVGGLVNAEVFLDGIVTQVPFLLFVMNPAWLILALLLGLLAEIFRIGGRLADDVDGLV